jgi:hypothetical protein
MYAVTLPYHIQIWCMWERRMPLLRYQVTVAAFTGAAGLAQIFPYAAPHVTFCQITDHGTTASLRIETVCIRSICQHQQHLSI